MSHLETLLIVKSAGGGKLEIRDHKWSEIRRRFRHIPESQITVENLFQFAEEQLRRGRQLLSVELSWYVYDRKDQSWNMGRKRLSRTRTR